MIAVPERWGEVATLRAIVSGAASASVDVLEAAIVSGRVLRSTLGTADERSALRRNLSTLLRAQAAALDAAWRPMAERAREALETWAGAGSRLADLLSLLWLRDDLESVSVALLSARLDAAGDEDAAPAARLNQVLDDLRRWCERFDGRADEQREVMRRVLAWSAITEPSRASLEALQELVSCAENPWWLELVDPVFVEAGRRRGFAVRIRRAQDFRGAPGLRAAAATTPAGDEQEYDLGAGVSLCVFREARGSLRALVAGLDAGAEHELFWDGPAAGAARLAPSAELEACDLPEGFAQAEHVGVRRRDA